VYDPLYVLSYYLPILRPKEEAPYNMHDNDSKSEPANVEPKNWKDYLSPPNPDVCPLIRMNTLTD
jgi:hypothetical protein